MQSLNKCPVLRQVVQAPQETPCSPKGTPEQGVAFAHTRALKQKQGLGSCGIKSPFHVHEHTLPAPGPADSFTLAFPTVSCGLDRQGMMTVAGTRDGVHGPAFLTSPGAAANTKRVSPGRARPRGARQAGRNPRCSPYSGRCERFPTLDSVSLSFRSLVPRSAIIVLPLRLL